MAIIMDGFKPEEDFALELDARDELAAYREAFVNDEPGMLYLDGNSLGRLPHCTISRLREVLEVDWGRDLIRSWNRGWYQAPARVGDQIARLLGASPGQVVVCDSTSVNLFKLVLAALKLLPGRVRLVSDNLNFPSDLYILQGVIELLGGGHELQLVPSPDGIAPDLQALYDLVDKKTALVTLSHVAFKSGYLYDAARITEHAHQAGALVLWDLSHSAGAVPVDLDRWEVDLAVGCTYKHLNGGPGAPAFLYVRRDLQESARSPIWGWFGQRDPFVFDLEYTPAPGIARFLAGTPPILSLLAMEAGLEPLLSAGLERIRRKSVMLGEYLIYLADLRLAPLGFTLGSPRDSGLRGSQVSLRHPEGYRINRALIEEMGVLPDFRAPDNLRLGLTPLYTSFHEVWQAIDRIAWVVSENLYDKYSHERLTVT
jgi:kynureninase